MLIQRVTALAYQQQAAAVGSGVHPDNATS